MDILRTPEEQFENLPGFPFTPHYVEVNGTRLHYVDEGSGEVILCLHGEPTWSYLYRKMIPPLAAKHRVVTMDFVGFGRSDKYPNQEDYTFQMHLETLIGFIEALDLQNITIVVQDWGGILGLTAVARRPDRFARLVIMNTGLPAGERMPDAFMQWRDFCEKMGNKLPVGRIIRGGTMTQVPAEVIAAYEAPFPDESYKAGAAAWPLLVPIRHDDPAVTHIQAARQALSQWQKPALVMFSDGDPITRGGDKWFRRLIPTAADQPEIVIPHAGHFLQEDRGAEIAQHILAFMDRTQL